MVGAGATDAAVVLGGVDVEGRPGARSSADLLAAAGSAHDRRKAFEAPRVAIRTLSWCQDDTMGHVTMTLRLTNEEQAALRRRADLDGISMQEAARKAVREYVARSEHRSRVSCAAERVIEVHAEALERLGR